MDYVDALSQEEFCVDRVTRKKRVLQCSCLHILQDNHICIEAVARYMIFFFKLPKESKQQVIIEWIKYTKHMEQEEENSDNNSPLVSRKLFLLPFVKEDADDQDNEFELNQDEMNALEELTTHRVCKSAIAAILDFGIRQWKTCTAAAINNTLPRHGNKNKQGGRSKRFNEDVKGDLFEFFEGLKELAQPTSTRFVRENVGTGLRDDELDLLELPSSWSKRGLYNRFCDERGWEVKTSSRGTIQLTKKMGGDEIQKPICCWRTFQRFWKREYPNLRLQMPSEDICTECHTFHHRFRHTTQNINNTRRLTNSNNDLVAKESSSNYFNSTTSVVAVTPTVPPQKNADVDTITQALESLILEENPIIKERSDAIHKATLHIHQAAAQRKLANKKIKEAILDANKQNKERSLTFIADYSQNMEVPFFGESQPGDTYYFTPLKVNVFGIVDCSVQGGALSAHVYTEGQGKKGGNNVASLLLKELSVVQGLIDIGNPPVDPIKELNIIMDNCGGQNKNNMVLRLAAYLVEMKYFMKVNFIFYIVGHTKNACDRWFNTLKKTYRRSNVYTMEQLLEVMKTNENINVNDVTESDFKDFDKFLNQFYKKLESGSVSKNHVFTVEASNPTILQVRLDDIEGTPSECQQLLKKHKGQGIRIELLMSAEKNLEILASPGVPDIKKVELYKKYRPLIPEQYRDITCPHPGEDVLSKIKTERNKKAQQRQKAKNEKKRSGVTENSEKDRAKVQKN